MTETEKKENEAQFLRQLSKLTNDYGLLVDGCGCCGSPFLTELAEDRKPGFYSDSLSWQKE